MTDWKIQDTRTFGILNKVFSEFPNPSEHLAVTNMLFSSKEAQFSNSKSKVKLSL
jgi:hypothetical protein